VPLQVTRALTLNESGEPTRTFRAGNRITLQVDYVATDIPANTRVAVWFYIQHLAPHGVGAGNGLRFVYFPTVRWKWEGTLGPGSWFTWTTWRLSDREPPQPTMSLAGWDRMILQEPWGMSSWPGPWDFTGFVTFGEPPREGQFDHSRERWIYQLWY
jgi:hypothetical protein